MFSVTCVVPVPCYLRLIKSQHHVSAHTAEREIEASDMTALEAVMSVNEEKTRLEAKAEKLNTMEGPEVEQLLIDIYERCDSSS